MYTINSDLVYEAQCELDTKTAIKMYEKVLDTEIDLTQFPESHLEALRDTLANIVYCVDRDLKDFEAETGEEVFYDDFRYYADQHLDLLPYAIRVFL